jgi:uncharacterized protein involved in type VI secretion and phage assembly
MLSRESDLDFVARLLAQEGLSYRFEHLEGEAAAQETDGWNAYSCWRTIHRSKRRRT